MPAKKDCLRQVPGCRRVCGGGQGSVPVSSAARWHGSWRSGPTTPRSRPPRWTHRPRSTARAPVPPPGAEDAGTGRYAVRHDFVHRWATARLSAPRPLSRSRPPPSRRPHPPRPAASQDDAAFRNWGNLLLLAGLTVFVGHLVIYVTLRLGLGPGYLWAAQGCQFATVAAALWRFRPRNILPTNAAERQLWSIWRSAKKTLAKSAKDTTNRLLAFLPLRAFAAFARGFFVCCDPAGIRYNLP